MFEAIRGRKLFIICLIIFIGSNVACLSIASGEETPINPTAISTATENVVVQATPSQSAIHLPNTSTPTSEPTLAPTATQTATVTKPPTPTATRSPLQKVGELPVSGQRLVVSTDGALIAVDNFDTDLTYIVDVTEQSVKWVLDEDSGGMTGHTALDFSPDGSLLATGGILNDVVVWDMNNGEIVYRILTPYWEVTNVSFSADGQLLAVTSVETYSADAGVLIYSMNTGELVDKFPSNNIETYPPTKKGEHFLKTFSDFGWFMGEAAFVPNQPNLLAITVNDPEGLGGENPGALYFWDMENQQLKEILKGSFGSEIATSPDGRILFTDIDNHLYGWDILNEKNLIVKSTEGIEGTEQIAVTDNGLLARLNYDGIFTLWNLSGELVYSSDPDTYITDIAFTPNGDLLIAHVNDADDPIVEVWKIDE